MGGCVSSPKDLALNEGEAAPIETPTSPKNIEAETETVAQENTKEGGDEKTEETLVPISESKEEIVEAKPEEAVAATETTEAKAEEPKTEEKKEEPLVTL